MRATTTDGRTKGTVDPRHAHTPGLPSHLLKIINRVTAELRQ